MRMTEQQFDTAVEQLQQNQRPDDEWLDIHARIVTVYFAIKQQQGVPDDAEWTVPPEPELLAMVREFLADLSAIQRKRLKRVAESIRMERTTLH
jgi:dUTPase